MRDLDCDLVVLGCLPDLAGIVLLFKSNQIHLRLFKIGGGGLSHRLVYLLREILL